MNTSLPATARHQTGSFDRLMETYEQNYILMRRLFGDLKHLRIGDECAWSAGVSSKTTDKSKFTLDIQFTDHLVVGNKKRPLKLNVRVYHDARTAELLDPANRDRCLNGFASKCTEQQLKRNQLLRNWLAKQLDNVC